MPERMTWKEIQENVQINGIVEVFEEEMSATGLVMEARWKGNVRLRIYHMGRRYLYMVVRNDEQVSASYYAAKADERFFQSLQALVHQIENGDFNKKKTQREKIIELVQKRNLTSCMNQTKWNEFLHAMTEEMTIAIPYAYKTLFEDCPEKLVFGTAYDIESFCGYCFWAIEWVKLKPRFTKHYYQGRLLEDKVITHNVEKEFLALMEKYHIPCVYDSTEEVYVIYGYQ